MNNKKRFFRPRRTMDMLSKIKQLSDLLMRSLIEMSIINMSSSSAQDMIDKKNKLYADFFNESVKIFLKEE